MRAALFVVILPAGCGARASLPAPQVSRVWGSSGHGPAELFQPTGIAVASDGTVFVADTGNDRVQVFEALP